MFNKFFSPDSVTANFPDLGLKLINADSKLLVRAYKIARDFGTLEQMAKIVNLYNNLRNQDKLKTDIGKLQPKRPEVQLLLTLVGKE